MRVRLLLACDYAEWRRMRSALWPDQTAGEMAMWLARPDAAVLVAERPGADLCGFAEVGGRVYADGCATSPVAYLEGWYVDADRRRQGVGAALIAAVVDWARARGYRELASDAELDNHASHAAHSQVGFREVTRAVLYRMPLPHASGADPIDPSAADPSAADPSAAAPRAATGATVLPVIESARSSDLASIIELLAANRLPVADLDDSLQRFLVIRLRERPIATIALEPYGPIALLRSLCVAELARGQGLAAALCVALESDARRADVQTLYLLTTTAQDYFTRRGFQAIPRDRVPAAIATTAEFRTLCPSTAIAMCKHLQRRSA